MKILLQSLYFYVFLLLTTGCKTTDHFINLGDPQVTKTWIYLCGLTQDWNGQQETENRKLLKKIATEESINIIAVKPFYRCKQFHNMLCWPHKNSKQIKNLFSRILHHFPSKEIAGFIGFSNGGFFLNKLCQEIEVSCPLISIGSSGYFNPKSSVKNNLYLIIGKEDVHHYKGALEFYNQAQNHLSINVKILEHDGGHIIPKSIVKELIHTLNDQN